jgi:glycosyltransferase involved in cell wall biosynthesis
MNSSVDMPRVLVFIPTFNDVALLPGIIDEILGLDGNHVPLVIDDGSSPRIQPAALPKNCLFFSLPDNMGLGMCTNIALDHAEKYGYDALLRIDSDGQHPVAMVPELLSQIHQGSADLVVGTRENHADGKGFSNGLRKFVKAYFSIIARAITRGNVPDDVNSGFFALGRNAVSEMSKTALERFPEPQLFIRAHATGLRITEVPVTQLSRQHGKSTLSFTHAARMIYRFSVFAIGEMLTFRR